MMQETNEKVKKDIRDALYEFLTVAEIPEKEVDECVKQLQAGGFRTLESLSNAKRFEEFKSCGLSEANAKILFNSLNACFKPEENGKGIASFNFSPC